MSVIPTGDDSSSDREGGAGGTLSEVRDRGVGPVVRRKRKVLVAAFVTVAVVAGLVGIGISGWLGDVGAPPPPPAGSADPAAGASVGYAEFVDPQAGFAVSYPADWPRQDAADPQVRLLAARDSNESLLVRVVDLDVAVGPSDIGSARKLTDEIVKPSDTVTLLDEPKRVDVAGLPGLFYFYSFKDAATGQVGAHSHVFLFKGKQMITIVGQALPADHFPAVAPTFDTVLSTFRVLP